MSKQQIGEFSQQDAYGAHSAPFANQNPNPDVGMRHFRQLI